MCPHAVRHELLLQCVHQIFEHEYTRGNYVSSCCTGTNYYCSVYIKYLNMNKQEAIMCPHVVQAWINIAVCTSNISTWMHKRQQYRVNMNTQQYRVETALLVDRSDSDRCLAAIALCFLLSILCRAMLSCFCLGLFRLLLSYLHFHG